jgi:NADH-quinone oxidoreductase subunit N
MVTGATDMFQAQAALMAFPDIARWILLALTAGFAVKMAVVPVHMWLPDAHSEAPSSMSALLSGVIISAGAYAILRLSLATVFPTVSGTVFGIDFLHGLAIFGLVSAFFGSLIALVETDIKRIIAYSSIAHAGYMLSGIAAGTADGEKGILFYLAAYTFMNIGAFGIVSWVEQQEDKGLTFDDYAGLSARQPALAALMSIFMFSLAGIPPFAGFFGKYYVFLAAVKADLTWLAIVGVLTSLVSVYYYLRLVVVMYFREGEADVDKKVPIPAVLAVSLAAALVIVLGIYPSLILDLTKSFFKV